jgi:anthranilate synthase component 1
VASVDVCVVISVVSVVDSVDVCVFISVVSVVDSVDVCGGWFVYLSYELIGQIEPILRNDLLPSSQAVAIAVKIPTG